MIVFGWAFITRLRLGVISPEFEAPAISTRRCVTASLINPYGRDQYHADSDLLPERLHACNDETILKNSWYTQTDNGSEHRADSAEQTRAADHDRGNNVQIRLRLAVDGSGVVLRQRERMPARPASPPEIRYIWISCRLTFTPTRLAASSFDPTAAVYSPKRVL